METGKGRQCDAAVFRGERGRRRGGSTVPEADDTAMSGTVDGEAEGGGYHLEVEDDQRKLG
jgi:hypothetical protein